MSRPRYNSKERGRSGLTGSRKDDRRSGSKETNRREFKNYIGCNCESFVKMRKNAKEMNILLCEGYDINEEILVNYTEKGKKIMILYLGAPVSLAGKEWMTQYLGEQGLEIKDLKMQDCYQIFIFGPSRQYVSKW